MDKQQASLDAVAALERERLRIEAESREALRTVVRAWIDGELETVPRARRKRTGPRAEPMLWHREGRE